MYPQFFLPVSTSLFRKVVHVSLTSILKVPTSQIILSGETFLVQTGSERRNQYNGVVPLLQVLRDVVSTNEGKLYLGSTCFLAATLVNQWVTMGARLESAVFTLSTRTLPSENDGADAVRLRLTEIKELFDSIEKMLLLQNESLTSLSADPYPYLAPQTLDAASCFTFAPTIADFLLYAAMWDCGPLFEELAHPATKKWFSYVHQHPLSFPIDEIEKNKSKLFFTAEQLPSRKSKGPLPGISCSEGGASHPSSTVGNKSKPGDSCTSSKALVGIAGTKSGKSVGVKPTEEDIARRRLEKEKAKKEKEAQKVAAAVCGNTSSSTTSTTSAQALLSKGKEVEKEESIALLHQILDIRVGRFTHVRHHPNADRLYVEDMEIGQTETEPVLRTVVSGLVGAYPDPNLLENTLCLVVCNMKPKPLKGVPSEGMVLCASSDEKLVLVRPPEESKPGDRVVFSAEASPQLPPVLENNGASTPASFLPPPSSAKLADALSSLGTNAGGVLCWKGQQARLPHGLIIVPDMANCRVK